MALTKEEQAELDSLNAASGNVDASGALLQSPLSPGEQAELDELNRLAGQDTKAPYSTMQALEDTLRSGAQGVTVGHLPQVQGALKTGAVSGPGYEAAKREARKQLYQAHERNPVLATTGEVAGSMALPTGAGFVLPKVVGPLKGALLSAIQGALQNPGGDIDAANLKARLPNTAISGLLGAIFGKLQQSAGPAAERRAFAALGPSKKEVMIARQKDRIQGIGRTVLDEDIIQNIPRSKETLYERAGDAASEIGAEKSEIINVLDEEAGALGHINIDDVAKKVVGDTSKNVNMPGGPEFNARAQEFAANIGRDSPFGNWMPLKMADKLKTDTGKDIGWLKTQPMRDGDKESLLRSLYGALKDAVDKKADWLTTNTVLANPYLKGRLQHTNKTYGEMTDAKRILDNRIAAEESGRALSPTDYAVTIGAGVSSLATSPTDSSSTWQDAALRAILAGATHKFARQYGNQFAAKQLDNTSRALNYAPFFNAGSAMPSSIYGTASRSAWGMMKTTKEE